ncbi:MAG: YncE family protein [Acidobacteria bacterium]|nr:YncE family protein [Acidobacteriota bacterium]
MRSPKLLLFPLVLVLLAGASAAQLHQVAIIDIPGRPGFDSIAFANGMVVIAHHGANAVDVFDPARRRLSKQIPGMADPRGIAVDDHAGVVYVGNADGNNIAVISSRKWEVQNTIPLQFSPDSLLLVAPKLYVADWRNRKVAIVDPAKNVVVASVDVGGRPQHMVADSSGTVFVTVEDTSEVVAIGPENNVAKRFHLAASQPTGIAIDEKFRRLFVAVRYAVLVLNADTGTELARVPAEAGTDSLWFDPSNGALYAAASNGSVNMISTQRNFTSEHELKTEVRGHTLAFDAARKMVYMPGGREGRSKLVILKRVETPGSSPQVNATGDRVTETAAK